MICVKLELHNYVSFVGGPLSDLSQIVTFIQLTFITHPEMFVHTGLFTITHLYVLTLPEGQSCDIKKDAL